MAAPAKPTSWKAIPLLEAEEDGPSSLHTPRLLTPLADGNLLLMYGRVDFDADVDAAAIIIFRPDGSIVARRDVEADGSQGLPPAWSPSTERLYFADVTLDPPIFPAHIDVRIRNGCFAVEASAITEVFADNFLHDNPAVPFPLDQRGTPCLHGPSTVDDAQSLVVCAGVDQNSIFGPGQQMFYRALDLTTGVVLAELVYQLPDTAPQQDAAEMALIAPGLVRTDTNTGVQLVSVNRSSITLVSDTEIAAGPFGIPSAIGVPRDATTVDLFEFDVPETVWVHGQVSSPVVDALTVHNDNPGYPNAIGEQQPSEIASYRQYRSDWIVKPYTAFDPGFHHSVPGLEVVDRATLTTNNFPAATIQNWGDPTTGRSGGAATSIGNDLFLLAFDYRDTSTGIKHPIVLLRPGLETYLRMTQRDDGSGIARHPRLPVLNAATSRQSAHAPRVGDHNTYS